MIDRPLKAIPTNHETFNKLDVFILGDIDSTYSPPAAANDHQTDWAAAAW